MMLMWLGLLVAFVSGLVSVLNYYLLGSYRIAAVSATVGVICLCGVLMGLGWNVAGTFWEVQ